MLCWERWINKIFAAVVRRNVVVGNRLFCFQKSINQKHQRILPNFIIFSYTLNLKFEFEIQMPFRNIFNLVSTFSLFVKKSLNNLLLERSWIEYQYWLFFCFVKFNLASRYLTANIFYGKILKKKLSSNFI